MTAADGARPVTLILPRLDALVLRMAALDARLGDAIAPHELAALMKERGRLAPVVALVLERRRLLQEVEDAEALAGDPALAALAAETRSRAEAALPALEADLVARFLDDEERGPEGVILEVRAGTGGEEAALFAAELVRMYTRFCERQGLLVELLDESGRAMGGVREAVLSVSGAGAWKLLRFESGGHRVQRVPATEAQGRLHTSAATVAVLPEADEAEIVVSDGDLRIEAFRASGPGGQNVNKTSTAIRVTHIPTGLSVSCQDEKSQSRNRERALKILRARLLDQEEQRLHAARSTARKVLIGSGDRSERIRTYNFPQDRVTDHRIGASFHALPAIMDGHIDDIVAALGASETAERLKRLAAGNG